jgi:hypothetical protein
MPADGGGNEILDRIISVADNWVYSRKHRKGRCRGVLPIHRVSRRLRRKGRRRAAPSASRTSCGRAGNAHEPWRSGQSRGQALRLHGRGAFDEFCRVIADRNPVISERPPRGGLSAFGT